MQKSEIQCQWNNRLKVQPFLHKSSSFKKKKKKKKKENSALRERSKDNKKEGERTDTSDCFLRLGGQR
jgi:hypothetical protein